MRGIAPGYVCHSNRWELWAVNPRQQTRRSMLKARLWYTPTFVAQFQRLTTFWDRRDMTRFLQLWEEKTRHKQWMSETKTCFHFTFKNQKYKNLLWRGERVFWWGERVFWWGERVLWGGKRVHWEGFEQGYTVLYLTSRWLVPSRPDSHLTTKCPFPLWHGRSVHTQHTDCIRLDGFLKIGCLRLRLEVSDPRFAGGNCPLVYTATVGAGTIIIGEELFEKTNIQ